MTVLAAERSERFSEPARPVMAGLASALPCSACGAPTTRSARFCTSCGAPLRERAVAGQSETLKPPLVEPPLPSAQPDSQARGGIPARTDAVACHGCGSVLTLDAGQRSYICPFCGEALVARELPQAADRHQPEFVLGFAVTPEAAKVAFAKWLADGSWFRPSDLKKSAQLDKIQGVYLPFWHFAMEAQSRWAAEIAENWTKVERRTVRGPDGKERTETVRRLMTEWFGLDGEYQQYHFGHLVPASTTVTDAEAQAVGPFPLEELTRYRPHYLAGWSCEEYTISRQEARQACQRLFEARQQQSIQRFLPGDGFRSLRVQTQTDSLESDLVLLPIYVLSYRYKGKQFRFLANGFNGRISGKKPIAWSKLTTLAILLLLAIIGLGVAFYAVG